MTDRQVTDYARACLILAQRHEDAEDAGRCPDCRGSVGVGCDHDTPGLEEITPEQAELARVYAAQFLEPTRRGKWMRRRFRRALAKIEPGWRNSVPLLGARGRIVPHGGRQFRVYDTDVHEFVGPHFAWKAYGVRRRGL